MIRDRIIVSIGSAWDYDPTSKHQIMKRLAQHNRVVWINYHGSRRPTVGSSDMWAICAKLLEVSRGIRRVSDSMIQVTPLVVPGAKHPWLQALHRRLLIQSIRRAIRHFQKRSPAPVQVWSFAPDVPFLVGQLGEEKYLYYCVDEFSEFDGYDADSMKKLETEQIQKADLVVATSQKLQRNKQEIRDDVVYMPHGVDHDHFAAAWRNELTPPAELLKLGGPVFGFFGLIHHWVDIELLKAVALRRPNYQFVMIGEAKVDLHALEELDNVHLLGRKPYEELPAYCAGFDAAMMLFRQNSMTENVNPIKMQEYLAAGLPIVSTPLPEASGFSPYIVMAANADAYAAACDQVLVTWMKKDRPTISDTMRGNGWNARIERISKAMLANGKSAVEVALPASQPKTDVTTSPAWDNWMDGGVTTDSQVAGSHVESGQDVAELETQD
ncbi:MAG: glycosyltransferase [Phycisphaerae bacterium]